MIKVLNILGGMNFGGIERVLLNYATKINRNEFAYDFLTCDEKWNDTQEHIQRTGSKIFYYTRKKVSLYKNIKESFIFLFKNRHYYDVIHVHLNYEGFLFLLMAKLCGYRIRISHSHTSFINGGVSKVIKVKCWLTSLFSNYKAGCSRAANIFLYGSNTESKVIPNAINYDEFYYNNVLRTKYRNELGIKNSDVAIVLIGRFNEEKNHKFICELMHYHDFRNLLVFFIGEGERKALIGEMIDSLSVGEHVKIIGNRTDVQYMLNAFDALILPSLHEGFPMVMLEGQVNGLKCIVSDNVPRDTDISGNVEYLPLSFNYWSQALNEITNKIEGRLFYGKKCNPNYNVIYAVNILENYYKELLQ